MSDLAGEEKPRTTRAQLLTFVRQAPISIAMLDRNMTYLAASDRWVREFGRGYTDLAGLNHYRLFPDLPDRWKEAHQSALAGETLKNDEDVWTYADGSQSRVRWAALPWRDEEGGVGGIVISAEDITGRKREEKVLFDLDALGRLHKVSSLFLRDQPPQAILEEILDAAVAISEADFGNIQLLDPRSSDLEIVAHRNFPPWWLEFWNTVSKGVGVCGTALARGERVIVEDISQSPIFAGTEALAIQLEAGVRAVQSTPLITRSGAAIGMISTHFRQPHRPPDDVLRLLDLLARQAADVIERVQGEAAFRQSEAKFRGIVSISADALISIDREQRITMFNEGAEKIFGYARAEVIGAPIDMLIPARFREIHREHARRFAAGPQVSRRMGERKAEISGLRKSGEEFPAEAAISKLEVGSEVVLTVALRDVTARKRTEIEQRFLAEAGSILTSTLDYEETLRGIAQLVVRELAHVCIVDVFYERVGIRRLEVATRDPSLAWARETLKSAPIDRTRPGLASQIVNARAPILIEDFTPEMLHAFAQTEERLKALLALDFKSCMAVPLIARGNWLGILGIVSSDRPYRAEDLRLAEALAQRASVAIENARLYLAAREAIQARDEVMSVVAHDLRNPLHSIFMQSDLLTRRGHEPERRLLRFIEVIRRSASRMNRIIEDLLDVTRLEAGRLALERTAVSSSQVVRDAVEAQRELAAAHSLDLQLEVAHALPQVWANRDRLLQIFENLIGNSLKFTQAGGSITVGAAPRGGEVLFWVKDTGVGIAPEHLPRLFERFWQANQGDRRGVGLGLPIVKGLVEVHGGRVWVESAVGQGSAFFFTILTAPRSEEWRETPAPPGLTH